MEKPDQGKASDSEYRVYLNVPYSEREAAKEAGASFDFGKKSWYVSLHQAELDNITERWAEWDPDFARYQKTVQEKTPKNYLYVPYTEKDLALAAGAKFDFNAKSWFAPEGANMEKLESWLTAREPVPTVAMNPVDEFAKALRAAGLDLQGAAPAMDGKIHRVPLIDSKPGHLDGAYSGHLDGVPNGWSQNYQTGEKTKWKATGHTLTEEQKAALTREAEVRRIEREKERLKRQDEVAKFCRESFENRLDAVGDHPYLVKKGIPPVGIKESLSGDVLLVPLYNAEGELRNVQEISSDGTKLFQAGGQKKGCFNLVDPGKCHDQGEILLAEGYATGVSLNVATGKPVAVAFDAGNLEGVAIALRDKFPEAKIVICADHDHTKEHNIGVEKAKQAAEKVGGCVIVPVFNKEELSAGRTDFNDLAQSRGLEEVGRQLSRGLSQEKCRGVER
ncbi:MAG: toprim domain-containing protein [Desulfovibrionaceae bacterium]|nr:toprim domain-containing protein [Desulfovibrionaceae bacterium]MBF0515103.1 toprim domain-containing protein [Desulfovibrionaceae bacterium]